MKCVRKWLFALTAVVLLAFMKWGAGRVVTLVLDTLNPPPSQLTEGYRTPPGERRDITLEDHTRIAMNSNTEVQVTEEGSHRQVNLLHGEASLSVIHDARRPFTVCAGGFLFRDVGTTFNVVAAANSVALTVADGEVSLVGACGVDGRQIPLGQPASALFVRSGGRFIGSRLQANDQMTIVTSADGVSARTRTLTRAEMSFVTSWRDGVLRFEGAGLRDAIEGVNRNCNVLIELGDPAMAAGANLHGTLRLDGPGPVDTFLKVLKRIYHLVPAPTDPLRPDVITLVKERGYDSK